MKKTRIKFYVQALLHNSWAPIVLPYVMLVLCVGIGFTYILMSLVQGSLEERLQSQLGDAAGVASDEVALFENKLLSQLRELTYLQGAYEAARDGDYQTLQELLVPSISNSAIRRAIVTDLAGNAVLDIVLPPGKIEPETDGPLIERNLLMVPSVQRVLDGVEDEYGDRHAGLVEIEGELYLTISGPFRLSNDPDVPGGELLGVVMVAEPLQSLLDQIKETAVARRVTVYDSEGEVLVTTLGENEPRREELKISAAFFQAVISDTSRTPQQECTVLGRRIRFAYFVFLVRHQALGVMSVGIESGYVASRGTQIRIQFATIISLFAVTLIGSMFTVVAYRQRRRRQARAAHFNPYVVGPPITEEKGFFGRRAELNRILSAVANNHFLISGERRIGKTSLLRQVARRLKELAQDKGTVRFWPVYFTLQGVPQTRFYTGLMGAVLRETGLDETGLALAQPGKTYDDFDFEEDLRQVIERLAQQAAPCETRLVLCLDELDALMTYPPAFREQLRAVVQAVEPAVRLVAAGVLAVEQEALRTSPFYNQFTRVELRALSREEAERLIRQLASDLYRFTEDAVDFIVEKSHGLPLEVQRLCHHAVNVMLDQDAPAIDWSQVELAFERALTDRTPEFQLAWWGGQDKETGLPLSPFDVAQRKVLREALANDGLVPRRVCEGEVAVFNRRQLYNLSYESADGLCLTALFAAWMKRNVPRQARDDMMREA